MLQTAVEAVALVDYVNTICFHQMTHNTQSILPTSELKGCHSSSTTAWMRVRAMPSEHLARAKVTVPCGIMKRGPPCGRMMRPLVDAQIGETMLNLEVQYGVNCLAEARACGPMERHTSGLGVAVFGQREQVACGSRVVRKQFA